LKFVAELPSKFLAGKDTNEKTRLQINDLVRKGVRMFSDSIFYYFTPPRDPQPAERDWMLFQHGVLAPVQGILSWAWNNGFAVRGSIGYGTSCISDDMNVILGPAILKVVQWEQMQNWPWVSIEPGSVELVNKLVNWDAPRHLVPYDVPTKVGAIKTHVLSLDTFHTPVITGFFVEQWRQAYKNASAHDIHMWHNLLYFFGQCRYNFPQLTQTEKWILSATPPYGQTTAYFE
jgi:hypothetical protein